MNADQEDTLPVVYSPISVQELDAIWDWNEKTYGRGHAARYVDFLERHINALAASYERGRRIDFRPELRYIEIRRRKRGHAHIAVYRVRETAVHILHVFHTAQDWQSTLADEEIGL